MSGTSSVPEPTFGDRGWVAPDESAILLGVFADLNAAFGGNLNTALETPQGQIASSETAIIGDKNAQVLFLANNVDPAYASGRMQDGIARIYFLTRNPAEPTVVVATCTGLVGTFIPVGALAVTQDGNLFICTEAGTIPSVGHIDLTFVCAIVGPVPCPATFLDTIYQSVPGWDTVLNSGDGVLGSVVESRADFEFRRGQSVAINSVGTVPAIRGAVMAVPGVLDSYVTENPTGSPATIGGVSIAARSIYVAVAGGAAADVARAIWTKKPPGCGYTGNTTVTVYDTNPGYPPPGIPYSVTFEIPTGLPIFFAIDLANNAGIPANAAALIQGAIVAAFAGADGGSRARIGAPIFASRFYAGIAALGAWAEILFIRIGSTNSVGAVFTASLAGALLDVTAISSGAMAVGQPVYGAGVAPATTIVAQVTGSPGGIGHYTVSFSQTVGSETMGALDMVNSITTNIDQVPTVTTANIALTLI